MSQAALGTDSLPGGDLVAQGLTDLAAGDETEASLLVSIAAPALRSLGHVVAMPFSEPELRLYHRPACVK